MALILPQRAIDLCKRLDERLTRGFTVPTLVSPAADWWLASLLFVAGPLVLAALLLAVLCGGGLWDCAPAWHDEVWYFNEMSVFAHTGWTGGYTVCQEWPARAEWVRFGTHGPFVPAIYGAAARFTGMHVATIPMLNATLLVLSSAFWVACCRLNLRQSWVAALIAVTYWPLILYIPTSMQEGLHLSIAPVLAALAVLLIRRRENKWLLILSLVAVAAAAQTRVTWAWVAVPMLWIAMNPRTKWQAGVVAAGALAFVAALYLEAILLVSAYPNFMKSVLDGAAESPFATCWQIFRHVLKNIERYFAPNHDTILEIAFRYQTLIIAGVAAYQLGRAHFRHSLPQDDSSANDRQPAIALAAFRFTLINVICIVGFVIAFYDVWDWRDYRVIAPHLLLALLVLVGCGAAHWLKRYALIGATLSVFMVVQFAKFHGPRVEFDPSQVASFAEQVGRIMAFEPDASGWDNTMLIDLHSMDARELLAVPRGIGISTVRFWDQQAWPPRSKYVLLAPDRARLLGIPRSMEKVAETRIGELYMRR
jgi:hypothetical protein